METKHTLKYWYRKRDALLKKLADTGPFIDASLVTIARACGNPRCRCAHGEKHRSRYLTYKTTSGQQKKQRLKTQTLYVPRALEQEVQEWVEEYRRLKKIMKQIADVQKMIVRGYVQERGRGFAKK